MRYLKTLSKRAAFSIAGLGLAVLLVIILFYRRDIEVTTVKLGNSGETIYCYSKYSGITADKRVVFISSQWKILITYDQQRDYIFHGLSPIFLKATGDTLSIYSQEVSPTPPKFTKRVRVVQKVLENVQLMTMLEAYRNNKDGFILLP